MGNSNYSLKSFEGSSHKIIANILEEGNFQNILDVGCDIGFLGQLLSYKPKNLVGIDKLRLPKLTNYSKVWQADIDKTNFEFLKGQKFDVIVLADILEHLKNPKQAIHNLKPLLKDNGIFITSLPNMGFFFSNLLLCLKIKLKMRRGLFDSSHLHDFTYQSAQEFLKSCSLKNIKMMPTPLPLPMLSIIFDRGKKLHKIYQSLYYLTKKVPSLLAYQIIISSKK